MLPKCDLCQVMAVADLVVIEKTGKCRLFLPLRRALPLNRSFCLLRVAIDRAFFDTVGKGSPTIVRNEIATLFSEVNEIFAKTDFDFDGHQDGIQFHIPEVEVFASPDHPINGLDRSSASLEELLDLWADVSVHSPVGPLHCLPPLFSFFLFFVRSTLPHVSFSCRLTMMSSALQFS